LVAVLAWRRFGLFPALLESHDRLLVMDTNPGL
jgi:hypothetical protein